jgi:hypothetical protein
MVIVCLDQNMAKYLQGVYKIKNPDKYAGNPTNVIFRSSYELKFMNWVDANSSVVKWSSEETIIPYVCPTDNRAHRYFVDFKIQIKGKDGKLKTYLVEIKPSNQRIPPKYPGRQTRRYLTESMTFMKNQSKWDAATIWAKDRDWEFIVLDEFDLGLSRQK